MTSSPDTRALYFLGRRVERLILGGILLVVLCFVETYLTTANKQFSEDRSADTITNLLNRLELDEPRLTNLFQTKPETTLQNSQLNDFTDEQKSISDTRKKLGLPPLPPSKPSERPPEPRTYKEALDSIIIELGNNPFAQRAELMKYVDPTKPPKELIQALHEQMRVLETVPTTVWGIQTPRLLQLQYAGLDYKFPFGFVSSLLEIALAPLIVGWFGALYATRQRELIMIAAIEDYKLAFPYILNFLPVNFQKIETQLQNNKTKTSQRINRKIISFHRIVLSGFRSFVVLIIGLPLLLGFTYSLIQLWSVVADEVSYLFYAGIVMAMVMASQILTLVVQEWVILYNKNFYE
jgi:hypothetical protein